VLLSVCVYEIDDLKSKVHYCKSFNMLLFITSLNITSIIKKQKLVMFKYSDEAVHINETLKSLDQMIVSNSDVYLSITSFLFVLGTFFFLMVIQ
jgi:hypothetical protein